MKKLILAAALAASLPAHAGEFSVTPSQYGGAMLTFKGDMDEGDALRMSSILEQQITNNLAVRTVFLDSKGGLIKEGVMMSNIVRNYGLNTIVMDGQQCASACFLVFAAGTRRTVGKQGYVGVHQAYNLNGQVSEEATRTMVRVSSQLGVSPAIIQRMKSTSPNNVAWLTTDELQESGVTVWSPERDSNGASSARIAPDVENGQAFIKVYQRPIEQRNKIWKDTIAMAQSNPLFESAPANRANFCEAETKSCTNAMHYKGVKGPMMLLEVTNYDNQLIGRATCFFPQATVRVCQNFDTGNLWRDVKNIDDKWETVEKESAPK